MGVFNNWPYTDVHQLNLDWILKVVKQIKDKEDLIDQSVEDAQGYALEAKDQADLAEGYKIDAKGYSDSAKEYRDDTQTIYNDAILLLTGSPKVVLNAADMDNTDLIYLYVGSEAGYQTNYWYYYDTVNSTWTPGGLYSYGGGINNTARYLLKYILQKVAYIDDGMNNYIDALYDALESVGVPATTASIINILSHVTTSNSAVMANIGDPYTATLTAEAGYGLASVTVLMNNIDVTAEVYNNGVINIPAVGGDIVITAMAVSYTLTLSGGELVSIHQGMSEKTGGVVYLNTGGTNDRRSILCTAANSDAVMWQGSDNQGTNLTPSGYYGIPIPADATTVTFSALPAGYYCAFSAFNVTGGAMYRTLSGSFSGADPHVETFTAGQYDYMTVLCKYGSGGSNIDSSTEITEFTVTFS